MHSFQIKEMADAVAVSLKLKDDAKQAVEDALTEYWYDKIAIVWTTEDVRSCKADISDEDAVAALQKVLKDHDASIGVRWDHLADACAGDYPDNDDDGDDEEAA